MLGVQVRLARPGGFVLEAEFSVAPGTVTAVFGPSGAGKTTLLDTVAGLTRPDEGRIAVGKRVLFDARRGVDVRPERREIGYVFQDDRLFPHLTVRRNLRYGIGRVPPWERRALERRVVDLLSLEPLLERRPSRLSGGERQRVTIGRALLMRPRVLLLDEPLSSLDAGHKEEILGFLARLRQELELPIVYVTHLVEEIQRLADRVVILRAGRVETRGPVEAVLGPRPVGERRSAGDEEAGAEDLPGAGFSRGGGP